MWKQQTTRWHDLELQRNYRMNREHPVVRMSRDFFWISDFIIEISAEGDNLEPNITYTSGYYHTVRL